MLACLFAKAASTSLPPIVITGDVVGNGAQNKRDQIQLQQQQQQTRDGLLFPLLTEDELGRRVAPPSEESVTTSTELPAEFVMPQASTQSYWLEVDSSNINESSDGQVSHKQAASSTSTCFDLHDFECGLRGRCDPQSGKCACFAGFSGPQCNKSK